MGDIYKKFSFLKNILQDMESILIAYSGGVDSTFLSKVASDLLGNRVLAVTASSETYPFREIEEAKEVAKILGLRHMVINTEELSQEEFVRNMSDRCYHCKRELFLKLKKIAKANNLNYVADGANYDDAGDYRPGMKAARELGIRSPLKEAELTKEEIRRLSKEMNLPTWNKPSFACLSSRVPYGTRITKEVLSRIEQAEDFLRNLGIKQLRVRDHDRLARIEVGREDLTRFLEENFREKIIRKFKDLGYIYITLDLQGYRTGSMNEMLKGVDGR